MAIRILGISRLLRNTRCSCSGMALTLVYLVYLVSLLYPVKKKLKI